MSEGNDTIVSFDVPEEGTEQRFFVDDRLDAGDTSFTVFLLDSSLGVITLSEHRPSVRYRDILFGVVNDKLFINGSQTPIGFSHLEEWNKNILVVDPRDAQTTFFITDEQDYVDIGRDEIASIRTHGDARIVLHGHSLSVDTGQDAVYVDDAPVTGHGHVPDVHTGCRVFTPEFLLERRASQWKLTTFGNEASFGGHGVLRQARKREFPEDFPLYRRSPRLHLTPPDGKFTLQHGDKPQPASRNGILKAVLPPIAMLAVTVLVSVFSGRNALMMLGMGCMSVVTAAFTVSQYVSEKKQRKTDNAARRDEYERYLVATTAALGERYERETQVLNYVSPSPHALARMIDAYDPRIYERMVNNADFLSVSLGVGDEPSSLTVESDGTARDVDPDSMRLRRLVERYSTQRGVPVTLNVMTQTVGLVGAYPVLQTAVANLLLQIAFFHSYHDVNLLCLVPEKTYAKDWAAWRFLPHFMLEAFNTRGIVHNASTRDVLLSNFTQMLVKRKQLLDAAGKDKPVFAPHYVLTIFDDSYLAGHAINEFLAQDLSPLGVSVIWCKEDRQLLPDTVSALIAYRNQHAGEIVSNNHVYMAQPFDPYPKLTNGEHYVRRLANLEHVEAEKNTLPESLSLLEQYEVNTVEQLNIPERWRRAEPNKSIRSLIGWRGSHEPMYWDLHERVHGPHALVGGMTGSGKSEFLTTFLVGLAINYSPEDVGMLIIDWKGGGIANTLEALPHFMGSITNLDGAGAARALASIKAELDKRMKMFARYGVNSINQYMSLYKGRGNPQPDMTYPSRPIPHLILVSDEFAELKANVPEFLDELTSVARIGRSLGVHLILATQKPSGVVNDQIEANAASKIALKMASEQDSNELLKTHDAAHITQPGRGYLKVGQNEVYDLFQSGYAGVPYDPDAKKTVSVDERVYTINMLGQTRIAYDPGESVTQGHDTSNLPTQLEAVIAQINHVFDDSGLTLPAKPWLPNLGTHLTTSPVKPTGRLHTRIPLGLLDIPSRQAQEPYKFDIQQAGHTVIFASPGYGKSTVLQTIVMNLARANTPEQVQFDLLDFGNNGLLPLKDLPHVADIVTLEETEKLGKMMKRISDQLAERKQLLKQAGVASLSQYETKTGTFLPLIITLVDSYDGLARQDARKETVDNQLIQLLREGAALGLYVIMSVGRVGSIRMNMMSNIQTKIALYLNDESELMTLMGRDRQAQADAPGRGQLMLDAPTAIQIYLPARGDTDNRILDGLQQETSSINTSWTGSRPQPIPMVPANLNRDMFNTYLPAITPSGTLYVGLNKQTATLESFSLFHARVLGVFTANPKQARITIPFMLRQLFNMSRPVTLIDPLENLVEYQGRTQAYIGRKELNTRLDDVKEAIGVLSDSTVETQQIIIINNFSILTDKLVYNQDDIAGLLNQKNMNLQLIILDSITNIGSKYNAVTTAVRENVYEILFGGPLTNQQFIEGLSAETKKQPTSNTVLHVLKDDEFSNLVVPKDGEQ